MNAKNNQTDQQQSQGYFDLGEMIYQKIERAFTRTTYLQADSEEGITVKPRVSSAQNKKSQIAPDVFKKRTSVLTNNHTPLP